MVNKFIKENYMEELEISAEDEPALFVGGSDSAISKLSSELGVDLSIVKARYVLVIKGLEEKVQMAVKRVKQFLYGGDGHTVSRIAITEQSLGVVIGKGGAKRAELEKKYEGISLFIHKSNRITIRGPEQAVEGCRIDILRLVSSMKIQEVLDITPEQYAILNAPELIRRATNGIPVQVTLTEVSVKIRGFFADVRDAKAMLKEPLFGFYEARVELDPSQLSCVRGACRNDGHFKRMEEIAGAKVSLDLATSAIVITGKRPNVKRAKVLVVEFIDFLLPSDFAHLKISKTLHSTVGDASVLADVAAVSGATVIFDRDTSSIEVQSSDPAKVKKAADILKSRIEEAEKLAFVVTLDQSDSWLIPLIIGKGGNRVNTFRLEFGCQVDISKEERSIIVSGDSEEIVAKARKGLDEIIDAARRECAFVQIPADAVAPFLGRAGANIQIFAKEHTVEIERMRKESSKFKISGAEGNVQAAKAAVAAFVAGWEERTAGTTIQVDKNAIPAIIGKGGQNISFIQNEYKCKVEINREEFTVSVRGGSEELREKALQKINQIIAEDKASFAARQSERHARCAQETDEAEATGTPKPQTVKATTNGATADSEKKDRTSEFSARPVGLTIVENEKPKKKRIRNKNKTKDISDDSTLQVGTAAGRNLFNLLVTEKSIPNTDDNATSTVSNSARAATIDQWDSSTVSSAKDDCSGIDEERSGFVRGTNKPYIKSASGFTVRV
jgi:transcription antitermination factor NusA-like protein